jgi:cysteine sulfinate desulfinase/cysteine desulfurase-like protein
VPTSSGLVQPVEQIGAIVKNYDCIYLLDACQSLGQLDVNALQTHAHFITTEVSKSKISGKYLGPGEFHGTTGNLVLHKTTKFETMKRHLRVQ